MTEFIPGWLEIAVSSLALFFGSLVFGATGFGIGMIATPLMLLVYEPQTAIVVTATVGLAVGIRIVTTSWQDIPFRGVLPISIAALCGAPIAVFILKNAESSVLSIGIAALLILFAAGSFIKVEREIPYATPVGILTGFIVGVLLPTTGVAGSLVMLFLMTGKWERREVRAAMAFFLVSLMTFSIFLFALWGLYTPERLAVIGVIAVPAILGLIVGAMLVNRINEKVLNHSVIGIIIVSSVIVIVKELSKVL